MAYLGKNPRPEFERKSQQAAQPPTKQQAPAPASAHNHDLILKSIQDSGSKIVVMTQGGETIIGKLVSRDKYSLTIDETDGSGHVTVYKHAIESFRRFAA